MTPRQRQLARITLGLGDGVTTARRNGFWAPSFAESHADFTEMSEQGLATVRFSDAHSSMFSLTREAAEQALEPGESLADGWEEA